jgi:hypothetical protein
MLSEIISSYLITLKSICGYQWISKKGKQYRDLSSTGRIYKKIRFQEDLTINVSNGLYDYIILHGGLQRKINLWILSLTYFGINRCRRFNSLYALHFNSAQRCSFGENFCVGRPTAESSPKSVRLGLRFGFRAPF